jgi:hypothetical protein
MADVKGLLSDPRFAKLAVADQKRALSLVDPAFAGLSDQQLIDFKSRMGQPADAPTPAPNSFGAELYQQAVAPMLHLASSVATSPTPIGDMALDAYNASADQGRQAWDALMGRGQFEHGYTALGRVSSAVGHGLGMLPVIGPAAAHAGDNIGSAPEIGWGPGAADVLGLAAQTLGPRVAARGWSAIPSTARAASALEGVTAAARDVPIDVSTVGDVALRTRDLASSGGSMPKVVSDFLKRATDPNRGPITFSEARDYYSNATRLSADEYGRLTPVMKRQVTEFTHSLGDAIQDAAEQVGQGDAYQQAMSEYRDAMRWQQRGSSIGDFALKKLLPGAGGAFTLYHIFRDR